MGPRLDQIPSTIDESCHIHIGRTQCKALSQTNINIESAKENKVSHANNSKRKSIDL